MRKRDSLFKRSLAHCGKVDIALLRLNVIAALLVHNKQQALDTHCKTKCGNTLAAELLNESVIASAAADSTLRADLSRDEFKDSLGVVIKSANDLRVDLKAYIQTCEVFFKALEVLGAFLTKVIGYYRSTLAY